MLKSSIESCLKLLPGSPGIYIFRNSCGDVIYVGKASNLRNRVCSYFKQGTQSTEKTRNLVSQIDNIEFVVTESEIAALILECQQIKKYRPRFNVMLKDDKSYPYIKVDIKNTWPTISITRRRYNDGAKYIGRVPSAWSARQTYEYIRKIFPLRSCSKTIRGDEKRPCLKYHIQRCMGPCIGAISHDQYQSIVRQTVAFLEGKEDQVIRELTANMKAASARMEFEKAAHIRDQIRAIKDVIDSNSISFNIRGEQDVIALARSGDLACVRMFSIKDSRLTADEHFIMEKTTGETDTDLIENFIKMYYSSDEHVPPQLWLQSEIRETRLLCSWLSEKRHSRVSISVPHKGARLRLLRLVAENAMRQLEVYKSKTTATPELMKVLSNLKDILGLSQIPRRIEGYDISNIQGTTAVGSMVVFENGVPRTSYYRRFKIRMPEHIDDYAMMRELIKRRFKHSILESKWAEAPDLVLIDGGKGHLTAAISALDNTDGTTHPQIISIAKENEEIFQPGQNRPVQLDKSSAELQLLQRIRDEAHRFAITYHRNLRSKKIRESRLDAIAGIGPARKKALIARFGSVRNLKDASVDELVAVKGITQTLAHRILEHLE